ncbi:unnamed protein product [Pieris macdunnoughi]|uniref:Centrosomal protein of 192 kDa n=1 Tax=Pieris macdunnoughi TaxID=345717 RepID=A0A821WW08_9NEOP|nr:unnamed protein product [Pieris macdunnoughi]
MDENNYLTPSKILRLLHMAEDRSFNAPRTILNYDDAINRNLQNPSPYTGESSSGILDLERLRGFGETSTLSTAFNPGEMTGRSTEAVDHNEAFENTGRHSVALESLTSHMERQTQEVSKLIRHSVASFSSKYNVDLSADENQLIKEKFNSPLDATTTSELIKDMPQSMVNLQDASMVSNFNMSEREVYFKQKCPNFSEILGNADSPDRYMRPSISEVSSHNPIETPKRQHKTYNVDQTLDKVPVRQPKPTALIKPSDLSSFEPETSVMSEMGNYFQHGPNYSVTPSFKGQKKITPTDIMLNNLKSSYRLVHEDTEMSPDESISVSKIADFLNRQSTICKVSDIIQVNQVKPNKKPLSELQMNIDQDMYVTKLKDTKKMNTASSSGTGSTVISLDNLKISEKIPDVIVTKDSLTMENENRSKASVKSKSPSTQSTRTTVQENKSFKESNSPLHSSKGNSEANTSHIPSPNIVYKELEQSVDWQDVIQLKRYNEERFAKAQWIDIVAMPVQGYVGISTPVTINITTRVDSWLTARFEPNAVKDITIELPRQPFLLSPGKNEKFIFNITCNKETKQILPFSIHLKDTSKDEMCEEKDAVEIDVKLPSIQAISRDGMNKVIFPIIQEKSHITKYFVIVSDCPGELELEMTVASDLFVIMNVQEIKKSEMSKVLMESNLVQGKPEVGRKLCRLSGGNAVKVTVMFKAPQLTDLDIEGKMATFTGILNINLTGVNTVLNKVDLVGTVGTAQLEVKSAGKVQIAAEPTPITVTNIGSLTGVWLVKFKTSTVEETIPFKVSPGKFELRPTATRVLQVVYTGPPDVVYEGYLILEEVTTLATTHILISGGSEKVRTFPIKTNLNNISWVKAGKKELSLKNSTNKKVQIRCHIVGEGFSIESSGSRTYMMSLGSCECRPLSVVFSPISNTPHVASLHLILDKTTQLSRKIKLHGCVSGDPIRWSGLVTYGETALVRAVLRRPIELTLYNRASVPAFISAALHFNLQYRCLSSNAELQGARRIMGKRGKHSIILRVDWPRLERRARAVETTTLATLTVLTGPEFTRRRILKILRDENNGHLDTSLLPEHLKVLAEPFDGEDPTLDKYLENFSETKASLNELIEGLQELTAQIDVPQDFVDDNTTIISDDTMLEHHTLCE